MIVWAVYWDTLQPNPALTAHPAIAGQPAVAGLPVDQSLGNLEGKELRFGTSAGATFAAATTAIACGSVNCAHDSLNPLAGLTPLTGMWLNCIFGGKGVGMINLLLYLIVGVFIAGLMVGRTPEYLGKKVEAREMKLAMLALLVHPIMILMPAGLFAATDWGMKSTNNPGAHGLSEMVYEFSSASANNGSEFGGLNTGWGLERQSQPGPVQPALGHCHGPGDALQPLHPGDCSHGPGRQPGPEEADAVHRGHDADRHVDVRLPAVGHDYSHRRAAVPAGGRAWGRWPSTWDRSRLEGETCTFWYTVSARHVTDELRPDLHATAIDTM